MRGPPAFSFALAAALGVPLEAPSAHAQPTRIAAAPSAAEPARSGPLELRVSYVAPPGCPSGAQFLDALQAHLAAGGDGAVDAVVHISGPRDGDFELSLRLSVAGSVTESHARAESCATLMELAALDASMARTPGTSASATVTPAVYMPEAPAATSPAQPPGADASPLSEGAGASAPAALRGFALAETRAASGMLPSLAWGQGLVLGAALGPWSLRLAGTWWLPESFVYDGDGGSPIPMSFEQRSLELAPCAGHALTPLLQLEGCVALSVNRTQASAGEREVWGAVAPALLAVLRPWRGLRVEAAAQLLVPFSAPSFAVQTLEDVFTASGVQPGARLAIGWELESAAPEPPATPPAFDPLRGARAGRAP